MVIQIAHVDAFTSTPFSGNPAAVCFLSEPTTERWMQDVAQEMNLSETAFLVKQQDGFDLRWFTPTVEVKLCGHATLASAHFLWESGLLLPESKAHFYTASGELVAERIDDWIELDFPQQPENPVQAPPGLVEALGVEAMYVGKNQTDFLIQVGSEELLRRMKPDWAALAKIQCRGVMVTSLPDSPKYDFVSRFFAPSSGIQEDPVTGSAHCCLGPFWQSRLKKDQLTGYQASARGGLVKVRLDGGRAYLSGQAVTVARGQMA